MLATRKTRFRSRSSGSSGLAERRSDDDQQDEADGRQAERPEHGGEPGLRALDQPVGERAEGDRDGRGAEHLHRPRVLGQALRRPARDGQHQGEHGARQVDEEDPLPRRVLHEQAAQRRAEHRPDPAPRRPQPDRAAAVLGVGRPQQRQAVGGQHRAGHALQHPGRHQHLGVLGDAGQRRGDREPGHAAHEQRPAAVAVAQRAGHDVQRRDGQRVGQHDPLLGGQSGVEIAADRGQRDVDDGAVDEGHRRADDGRDQDPAAAAVVGSNRRGCHIGHERVTICVWASRTS